MSPKVSIVMGYYNRKPQLLKTLEVLNKYPNKIFELIIVDDASEEKQRLEDCLDEYLFKTILIRISPEHKVHMNPCVPFNLGFKYAQADKIIIQNPECVHAGNLIAIAATLEENRYASFPCYAFGEKETMELINGDLSNLSFEEICLRLQQKISSLPQIGAEDSLDPYSVWYNHPQLRPVALHFASAICKKDLEDLGGFDERYAEGYAWDDTEFRDRVERKGMKITFWDQPVVHLIHSGSHAGVDFKKLVPAIDRNKKLYEGVTRKESTWKANEGVADKYIVHPPTVSVFGEKF